jgi:hypothetical protein
MVRKPWYVKKPHKSFWYVKKPIKSFVLPFLTVHKLYASKKNPAQALLRLFLPVRPRVVHVVGFQILAWSDRRVQKSNHVRSPLSSSRIRSELKQRSGLACNSASHLYIYVMGCSLSARHIVSRENRLNWFVARESSRRGNNGQGGDRRRGSAAPCSRRGRSIEYRGDLFEIVR